MANMTRDPWFDLRREIDEVVDDFFAPTRRKSEAAAKTFVPNLEISERDGEYLVRAELPGLKPEDVNVQLNQGLLTIQGTKREQREEKAAGYEYSERSYGTFSRSIQLPTGVDLDEIRASFADGVLTVHVPKGQAAESRRIEVSSSEPSLESSQSEKAPKLE